MNKSFYFTCFILVASFCTWLPDCQGCYSQPVNTNISNAVTFDGEPYIAINPTNPQNIVAAWMGLQFSGAGYAIAVTIRASFDGGNTWGTAVTLPHASSIYTSADISMAFDKNGLLYLCYIDFNQAAESGGDYVTRSFDGGLTWDSATEAIDGSDAPGKLPVDRPWLVVDNSTTANAGTLYITSKPAYWIPPPNRNYYTVSTDSGHTWSPIANVDGGNYLVGNDIEAPMAAPATTINGNFCAIYPSYVNSQNILPAYYLATSKNKGQTFSYSTVIDTIPAKPDTNLKEGYHLAANPADSNQMVAISVDAPYGEADILALHSNDGGQTWSTRVRVNDDPIGTGKDHDMPWCAYNGQGGLVAIWRDRRNSPNTGFWNAGYDFYYALSSDNGQTFSANQLLSSQFIAFDSIIADKGNDFMTCAYSGDTLYTIWGDTRSGYMNIYFTKIIASSDSTLSIALLQGDEPQWNVFPNPAVDVLNVDVSTPLPDKELSVYDSNGKKIYSSWVSSTHMQLSTSNWAAGTYFMKLGDSVRKVVKQ